MEARYYRTREQSVFSGYNNNREEKHKSGDVTFYTWTNDEPETPRSDLRIFKHNDATRMWGVTG